MLLALTQSRLVAQDSHFLLTYTRIGAFEHACIGRLWLCPVTKLASATNNDMLLTGRINPNMTSECGNVPEGTLRMHCPVPQQGTALRLASCITISRTADDSRCQSSDGGLGDRQLRSEGGCVHSVSPSEVRAMGGSATPSLHRACCWR